MALRFALLLCGLVAIAAASTVPFNNFRFMLNDTLFREVIDHLDGTPEGWADAITLNGNPASAWPRSSDNIAHVRYCYHDEDTKQKAADDIYHAWKVWYDAIGDPTPANGHALTFEEFSANGVTQYCRDASFNWNPDVPGDTVEIITRNLGPGYQGSATVGYTPLLWDNSNGRHLMVLDTDLVLSPRPEVNAAWLAHEIGHIFGLWHEHCRKDRDHYVHFECSNLNGYEAAKQRVENDGRWNMTEVCGSVFLGSYFQFPATEYSTEDWWDHSKPDGAEHAWRVHGDRHYDVTSIMHYASDSNDISKAVLAAWKYGNIDYIPASGPTLYNANIIPPNVKPSFFDLQGLRYLYPH